MAITTGRKTVFTGLAMTLLFLSTLAVKIQDTDRRAQEAHRLNSKLINFLLQRSLNDGTNCIIIIQYIAKHNEVTKLHLVCMSDIKYV